MLQRDTKISNLRVFAILFVVLGHSIILYSAGWDTFSTTQMGYWGAQLFKRMKTIISVFQMPLFMSISGYLYYYSSRKKKNFFSFTGNKFLRLVIPYILVGTFWMIPMKRFAHLSGYGFSRMPQLIYNKLITMSGNGHLWFVISLFIIFIVMYFVIALGKKITNPTANKIYDGVTFALAIALSYCSKSLEAVLDANALWRAALYLAWFYLGFLLCKYTEITKNDELYKRRCISWFALLVGCLMAARFFVKPVWFNYVCALGIVLILYIIIPSKTNKLTELIDKNSFGLYLFHSPMIYVTFYYLRNANPFLVVFINFFVCGSIALGVTILLRKLHLGFVIGEKISFKKKKD